jgi:hypothetical protein
MLRQVNERWPVRDKSSDGTIGDAAHAARESDHNPNSDGVVCARDITHDPAHGFDSYAFADMLLLNKDERIKYVISNRRISSGTGQSNAAWVWRRYSGANAHDHHVHISVKGDAAHYDNTAPWAGIGLPAPTGPAPSPQPALPAMPELQLGSRGDDVRKLQELLFVDGVFGPVTAKAVKVFQWDEGLDADGIVGPETWQKLLHGKPVAPKLDESSSLPVQCGEANNAPPSPRDPVSPHFQWDRGGKRLDKVLPEPKISETSVETPKDWKDFDIWGWLVGLFNKWRLK